MKPSVNDISNLDVHKISDTMLDNAIANTFVFYDAMGGNNAVAKGNEFVQEILEQLLRDLSKSDTKL